MFECLILGDSIASGMAQYAPACQSASKVGITTKGFDKINGQFVYTAKTVIVSLGTNDSEKNNDTYQNALALRSRINANNVIWVLPSAYLRPKASLAIYKTAGIFSDYVVSVPKEYLTSDGIHLRGKAYKTLTMWLLDVASK